jgi:PAS domain S-box-containing protein
MQPYAQLVSVGANAAVSFEDPVRAQEILNTLRANPQIVEAAIILEEGRILASYSRTPVTRQSPPWPKADGIYVSGNTAHLVQGLQRGGQLTLSMSLSQIGRQARQVYWMAAVAMLVLLAITFGQMAVLQRTIIRPIATLAEAAERVRTEGDYTLNLRSAAGTDEVASLGRSFDAMMIAVRDRENNLRRLTLFQRTLLDNVAYGIASTTPDGIVSSFNPAAERLLGYTADDVVGKRTPLSWHDPEEVQKRARQLSVELGETIAPGFATFTSLARRGLPDEYEWVFIRKDGTRVPVLLSVTALRDDHGQVTGFVGLINDLTERKQMERQYLHSQRMEVVGTLASGVAHDLNNILSPILMACDLLREKLDAAEDLETLAMIEGGAQRGASIIRQLLLFGRGVEGERAQINPTHLLKEMVKIMRETFPRSIVVVDASPIDLWTVQADATQLHQVLMNLCVNARDAMPEGGTLTAGAKNVSLGEDATRIDPRAKPGPYVEISVADTGQGIAPEVFNRIFDPFFTTKALGKGSGLGLSTLLAIVKSHDGFVQVDTKLGKGSIFRVFLPATTDASILSQASSTRFQTDGIGELILIVDDEAAIRATLRRLLERHHYRVLLASNGQEAFDLFRLHRDEIRLVITDLMMPVMDGIELVRSLKALAPDIKVVAASGLDVEANRALLLALGVTDLLVKPLGAETLLNAVRKQLLG